MSLRIWMPLNGNIKNQGLTNVETSNSGIAFTSLGKIGQSYYNTSAGKGVYIFDYMDELKTYENYSLCVWVKLVSSAHTTASIIISNGSSPNGSNKCFLFGLYNFSSDRYTDLIVPSQGAWNTSITLSEGIELNKWYHIVVTYDGTVTKAYVNGEYSGQREGGGVCTDTTNTYLKIGAYSYANTYNLNGYINDIRIYDHCLSVKEIKEIKKSLILHYKLDGVSRIDNIEYDCSGMGNNGTVVGSPTLKGDSPKYGDSTTFASSKYIRAGRGTMVKDELSVALWANMGTWSYNARMISCTQSGGWNFESHSATTNGKMEFLVYASGGTAAYVRAQDTIKISAIPSGWHHFAGTYSKDNNKICYYRDGVLISSATTGSRPIGYHASNGVFVAAEANTTETTPTTPYFPGSLSDVRIYATELSPDDVAEIYHTGGSIDNHGNLFCGELKES